MDGFGAKIERGVFADLVAIKGGAIGQVGGGNAGPRRRHIIVAHEAEQLRIGRHRDAIDQLCRFGTHRRLIGHRNRIGHGLERFVQRIFGTRPGERRDRCVAARQRRAWHGVTTRHAGAHIGDIFVEIARHIGKTLEITPILGGIFKRRIGLHLAPEERIAVERRFIGAPTDIGDLGPQRFGEHGLVELFLGRQIGIGNRRHRCHRPLPIGLATRPIRRGHAGKAITILGAQTLHDIGKLVQPPRPFGVVNRL